MELLVVDDEPQLSELMAEYLARCGYSATCAASADEALSLIKERHFSVLVSDITMPGTSGLELLRATKNISPATKVILITGSTSARAALEALEHGAFAVLRKPFSLQELRKKIDEAVKEGLSKSEAEGTRGAKTLNQAHQEESLSLNSKELQVLASMGAALALVDSQGTVLDVNEAFLKTFSRKAPQATGTTLCKAVGCALGSRSPCSSPCEMWDRLQKAAREQRSSGLFVCSMPLKEKAEGKHSLFHTRILVLPSSNGLGPGNRNLAVLMEDVSEVLDAEAQVLDAGCLGCLGEITRDIVHELAQPLNAISAQCQLLKFRIEQQGESSREVVLSSLEELQKQTYRMTEVLHHLRSGYRNKALEKQGESAPKAKLLSSSKI